MFEGVKTIELNNLDTAMFYANYKQDANFSAGKKSAMYNDRIYYQSAEQGEKGLYSMEKDGSNIRIEIPVEDMRKVQITDNGIYLVEYIGQSKNKNGEFRQFDLFYYTNNKQEKQRVLNKEDYALIKSISSDKKAYDIGDCYIKNNNNISIVFATPDFLKGVLNAYVYTTLEDKEWINLIDDVEFKNGKANRGFNLYKNNGLLIVDNYEAIDPDKNIVVLGSVLGENELFINVNSNERNVYADTTRGLLTT